MKARSREYRANGEKSVNRSGISQGLRSLILSSADGLPCPTCNTPMRHRRRSPGVESPDTATIEHILPIKEGGANAPDNLIAMCLACNRARGYAYNQTLKFTQADIDAFIAHSKRSYKEEFAQADYRELPAPEKKSGNSEDGQVVAVGADVPAHAEAAARD